MRVARKLYRENLQPLDGENARGEFCFREPSRASEERRIAHLRKKSGGLHGKSRASSAEEAEFSFGHFYRTIEEHIESYAAQAGNPFTLADIALRVGGLLQGQALREQLRDSELVSEVRKNGARSGLRGATLTSASLHVRPFNYGALKPKRVLSKDARDRIAKAQRERWAKFHASQDEKPRRAMTDDERRERDRLAKREQRARKGIKMPPSQRSATSRNVKSYWAKMTKEQRSAEMLRRRKVAAEKKSAA